MLTNFWFDLKYAFRLWTKAPGYFLVCTSVVALSVGLALWASVLVYTLTLKPLPFAGSEQWMNVQVAKNATAGAKPDMDPYTYQEVVKRSRSADHLGAYSPRTALLSEGHAASRLRAAAISPRLLAATGVAPLSGRLFADGDGQREAAPIAILSHAAWQAYFAGDPGVIGRQARIDGRSVQIVGVMPESFFAFDDFEVWFPLQPAPMAAPDPAADNVVAFIALKPGQSATALLAEMSPAIDDVNRRYSGKFDAARHLELVPAHQMFTHGFIPVQTMISLIAVAVLLLGCVNISLVFFARLLERSRELALRMALGSSRWRMLRQCLLESVLVMIPGLLLGVVLTALGVRWTRWISDTMSQYLANGRDGNPLTVRAVDLLVAVAIAAVLWLLSTLIPSWRVARQDAAAALGGSGKGTAKAGSARSASVIVGLQVLVSSLVLIVCMNLMMAVHEETAKPTGIATSHVMLSTYPTVFNQRYPDLASRVQYWSKLTAQIGSRVTGADVAYATAVPTRAGNEPVAIEGRAAAADQAALKLPVAAVSDNYFALLGVQLRAGRLFDSSDSETSLPTVVIDEVTARRYWPGQEVIGKRIALHPNEQPLWATVVGVVSGVGHEPYSDDPGAIYRPLRQANPSSFLTLAKLPDARPQLRTALQEAAYAADQDMPLQNLQMFDDYQGALDITYTALVPAFGVIAAITVVLAASGLFGLISRFVASRTQEIGVRRALGSSTGRIVALFMRQGGAYLLVGVVGGALGLLVVNVLSASLPNILSQALPVTLGVFLLLATVIFTATYLPTRRAVALEPADALRHE
jgi:predicted permease